MDALKTRPSRKPVAGTAGHTHTQKDSDGMLTQACQVSDFTFDVPNDVTRMLVPPLISEMLVGEKS